MKKSFLLLTVFLNSFFVFANSIDTLMVVSKSMNKVISNIIIKPEGYNPKSVSYPVLYLLHGAGGDFTSWTTNVPSLKKYADMYNILIVCPDGGSTSWYLDSPIDKEMKYETYISKELVDAIDKKYKTIPEKTARAITGLSMGGHGAFYLSFKHQDIWGAAGSMSGGLDIRPFPNGWDLPKRLGSYSDHQEYWEENTVINLVNRIKANDLKLIFDCGINDFFYEVNEKLHQKLTERNIPHDYIIRPGDHNWNYWANAIKYQLLFFSDYFDSQKNKE
ncbi:esterase family protein [Flavobacteriaceae bacterium]|nr:esterase family protein [Flavobacteriaceae bacterium]MDA9244828.1 esterase family protein [Flavobacteriaceae bacterium]MDB4112995.1 esterase family protein [Flavobacteriaceae bacterium]MDB4186613.1 esterase family protein [Flavobacteriaceae bacterium]MDC1434462.1 esterase family protein [Flavobacteriaceae bacterium]